MAKRHYRYEETHHTFKGVKQKRCSKCKKWKDESEFFKNRARKDGLKSRCKDCDKAYRRKRYRKNGKRIKEQLKYEDRHRVVRGVKEKRCCCCRQWRDESQFHKTLKS